MMIMSGKHASTTLGTATDLDTNPTIKTFQDRVGSLNTNDYYGSSFSGRSSLNPSRTATRLLDSTSYESNNTLNTAYSLGNLNGTRSLASGIGGSDINDYYRFTVGTTSTFSLSMTGMSADADVRLLNSTGGLIVGSTNAGSTSEAISPRSLSAGTYYVQVSPYSGSTNYNLSLSANPIGNTTTANWTFMVYMAGDNLESFGIGDFLEMSGVGSTSNVNIVTQFDRTAGINSSYGDWTDTRRGIVRRGDTPGLSWGTSIGEANMGDANTLSNFVNWGMTNYQANNYALVLWGHGSGFNVAYDDITGDSISATELSSVLGGLSRNISLVGTDACLMGMTEFAHQIRNNASVFVGSQELEAGDGWNYTTALSDLTANSTMTATQLGTTLVNRYGQHYSSVGFNGIEDTLSAIDLVALRSSNSNNLSARLSQFATTIMNNATSNDRSRLETHRANSGTFGDGDFPEYRDLGTLLSRTANDTTMTGSIRTAAQTALNAYNSVIIQNYSSINQRGTGLSINFQARGTYVDSSYNSSNLAFAADTVWDEFLRWWTTA